MTSSYLPVDIRPRRRGHAPVVVSFALLLAAGALPLDAQQRVEVRVRSQRTETSDSSQLQLRRLQRTLDSLTRAYNDSEDLTLSDRRRIEAGLTQTLERLEALVDRLNAEPGERTPRPDEMVRLRLEPGVAVRAAASMSRAMMQVREAEQATPRGWIGIETQGAGTLPRVEDGQLVVRYFSYPRILSVDPSSPAARAGLVPNDTLLAYNGSDVRENDISLTRLLRPKAHVVVRVLREGRVRDVPVTVVTAPTRIAQRWTDDLRALQGHWVVNGVPEGAMFPRAPLPPPPSSGALRATTRSAPTPAPGAPMPALAPMPPRPGYVFNLSTGGVAGAQLTTITEGLGRTIGVSTGVLVTSAPVGSPAHESGMLDGDVITRVEGQPVRSVSQVRALVGMAADNGNRAVDVELLRQKKTVKIQLKW